MVTSPVFREDQESYVRPDGITVIQRRAFCQSYFHYSPGQHVVFGGASTNGKTTLGFDLLEYIATPAFPAYVAVSKPQDPVTERRGKELGFRRVSDWPPQTRLQEMEIFGGTPPPGYLIWPPFGDMQQDIVRCARITSDLLMERYSSGAKKNNKGGVLFMDDTMVKAKIMHLDAQMTTILSMAGAMKFGLWIFVQKPTDSGRTTVWGYEQAKHLFLTRGGDTQMLKRYGEIVGTNGRLAMQIIPTLQKYQFLYVDKEEGYMCIVDAA